MKTEELTRKTLLVSKREAVKIKSKHEAANMNLKKRKNCRYGKNYTLPSLVCFLIL